MREEIKITLSKLTEQVNEGMKLKPLAEYYGIPVSRMSAILKQANLRIRSFRGPQVTLIDDTKEVEEESGIFNLAGEVKEESQDSSQPTSILDSEVQDFGWDSPETNEEESTEENNNNNLTPSYD